MNPFLFALTIWFRAQAIYLIALLCVSGYIHYTKPWIPFLNPFTIFESLAIVAGIVVFFLFVISLWLANGRFETPRALLIYACSTAMASCLSIGLLLPAMFPHAVHHPSCPTPPSHLVPAV